MFLCNLLMEEYTSRIKLSIHSKWESLGRIVSAPKNWKSMKYFDCFYLRNSGNWRCGPPWKNIESSWPKIYTLVFLLEFFCWSGRRSRFCVFSTHLNFPYFRLKCSMVAFSTSAELLVIKKMTVSPMKKFKYQNLGLDFMAFEK